MINSTQQEYLTACQELADYCGYSLEELFPQLNKEEYFLDKVRRKYRNEKVIRITREELIDYMRLPEFITLDKYMPGVYIVPGECGRLDGKRVIIEDNPMPPKQEPMEGKTVWK